MLSEQQLDERMARMPLKDKARQLAQVTVSTAEGDLLFALPVAWQEVADHG